MGFSLSFMDARDCEPPRSKTEDKGSSREAIYRAIEFTKWRIRTRVVIHN